MFSHFQHGTSPPIDCTTLFLTTLFTVNSFLGLFSSWPLLDRAVTETDCLHNLHYTRLYLQYPALLHLSITSSSFLFLTETFINPEGSIFLVRQFFFGHCCEACRYCAFIIYVILFIIWWDSSCLMAVSPH